jgi:hypothetical protein
MLLLWHMGVLTPPFVSMGSQRDEDCAGGLADGSGTGYCYGSVCRCHRSWSGPRCDIRQPEPLAFCDGGISDGNGDCCRGTTTFRCAE